ncbi:Ribonuclease H-like superfamily [Arabidopsis suecica]|uniref:Ribonuclease H-like superfamily n=1 Tax=Arabidopsis suecica TaxID=45249 RepID=A0A8T1XJX9_ARASU|nr:Ribonuclease H-like superfamily [Arabidopsis suecica]
MIGRADIEGSKSNVAMNAWLPQASYPCGNFSDTSSFKFRRSKGSIGHAFTVRIRTENQNQTSFYPFVPHEISVLVELILGHLRYLLTDVPPQPNSPPDNVLRPDRPAEASLGSKNRGCTPPPTHGSFHKVGLESSSTGSSFPADSAKPVPLAVVSLDSRQGHRIPLVRTSSELTVRRPGKALERAVPSPSPGRHAATRSRRGSSSSSPPTADGFGTGTPEPSPQSQSFSRSYGSILPTSLAYIVPSTRGCSPWRPDAVMSTTGRERHSVLRIFKGRRGRTGHHATCGALPAAGPYLRLSRFQDLHRRPLRPGSRPRFYSDRRALLLIEAWLLPRRPGIGRALQRHPFSGLVDSADERFARQYRCGPPPEFPLASPRSGIVHHLSGPDRHAHTRTLLRRSRSVGGAPARDPANQLPCALRVYSPVDSHTCQTPWSVFQDGSNGEPTGRRPEHADAEARRRCRNPRRSTPRIDRRTGLLRSASDRDASPAPIRFPPDNFKHSLTLFSKSFSSLPRGTCSLSVSRPYLALDGIYRPIGAAFPNNPTRRQRLVVRQGPGTTGLSPSLAPLSRELRPGPSLRTLLQTTIRTPKTSDFQAGLFPVRSPLLRESLTLGHLQLPDRSDRQYQMDHVHHRMSGRSRRPWLGFRPTACGNTRETSFRPASAKEYRGRRFVTPRQTCPRPEGLGRNLRSKTRWFTGFCNSHQVSHFATFFIDARAEISVAESRFRLYIAAQHPRTHRLRGGECQPFVCLFLDTFRRYAKPRIRRARDRLRNRPTESGDRWFAGRSVLDRFSGLLATSRAANHPRRRDPNTSPDHSIGRSDGRQIAPPTKNGHAPPPIESRKSSQSVNPYYVWTCTSLLLTTLTLKIAKYCSSPLLFIAATIHRRYCSSRLLFIAATVHRRYCSSRLLFIAATIHRRYCSSRYCSSRYCSSSILFIAATVHHGTVHRRHCSSRYCLRFVAAAPQRIRKNPKNLTTSKVIDHTAVTVVDGKDVVVATVTHPAVGTTITVDVDPIPAVVEGEDDVVFPNHNTRPNEYVIDVVLKGRGCGHYNSSGRGNHYNRGCRPNSGRGRGRGRCGNKEFLNIIEITKGHKKVLETIPALSTGLYYAKKIDMIEANMAMNKEFIEKFTLWHDRLGHPGQNMMRKLMTNSKGHTLREKRVIPKNLTCEACSQGKLIIRPSPAKVNKETLNFLERIQGDICGPIHPPCGTFRYFMVLIDASTRWSHVCLLSPRNQAFARLLAQIIRLRAHFPDFPLKTIRLDNAGEFTSQAFNDYCMSMGVSVEHPVAHVHTQNGLAESFIKRIQLIARPLLMRSKLPVAAWGHAVLHSSELIRIRPSSEHRYSPSQLLMGHEPDISHLKTFGCAVYIPIAPPHRTKMGPQRRMGIYVGFDSPTIIKYLEPTTGDLFKARYADCHFNESEFPTLGGETNKLGAIGTEVIKETILDIEIRPAGSKVQVPYNVAWDAKLQSIKEGIELKDKDKKWSRDQYCIRLNKSLYGLKQSGRMWYNRLSDYLVREGYKNDPISPCIFIKKFANKGFVIIAVYVDDLNILGTSGEIAQTVEYLKKEFEMKDLGKTKFCLGLQLEYVNNGILVHQKAYTEKVLKRFNMDQAHPLSSPMVVRSLGLDSDSFDPKKDEEEVLGPEVPYLSAIGALINSAGGTTRPIKTRSVSPTEGTSRPVHTKGGPADPSQGRMSFGGTESLRVTVYNFSASEISTGNLFTNANKATNAMSRVRYATQAPDPIIERNIAREVTEKDRCAKDTHETGSLVSLPADIHFPSKDGCQEHPQKFKAARCRCPWATLTPCSTRDSLGGSMLSNEARPSNLGGWNRCPWGHLGISGAFRIYRHPRPRRIHVSPCHDTPILFGDGVKRCPWGHLGIPCAFPIYRHPKASKNPCHPTHDTPILRDHSAIFVRELLKKLKNCDKTDRRKSRRKNFPAIIPAVGRSDSLSVMPPDNIPRSLPTPQRIRKNPKNLTTSKVIDHTAVTVVDGKDVVVATVTHPAVGTTITVDVDPIPAVVEGEDDVVFPNHNTRPNEYVIDVVLKGRGCGHYNSSGRGNHYNRGCRPNSGRGRGRGRCGISKPQHSTK